MKREQEPLEGQEPEEVRCPHDGDPSRCGEFGQPGSEAQGTARTAHLGCAPRCQPLPRDFEAYSTTWHVLASGAPRKLILHATRSALAHFRLNSLCPATPPRRGWAQAELPALPWVVPTTETKLYTYVTASRYVLDKNNRGVSRKMDTQL